MTLAGGTRLGPYEIQRARDGLREPHRKLFDLQGEAIAGRREALNAVSRTHDEMMVLFEADDALEDIVDGGGGKETGVSMTVLRATSSETACNQRQRCTFRSRSTSESARTGKTRSPELL